MKHQYQFDTDEERMKRAHKEALTETVKIILLFLSVPAILLLMGLIAFYGDKNMW